MPTFAQSLLTQLDAIPPFATYALARDPNKRRQRPSLAALAKSAGMPQRTFVRIARKLSWERVKAGDIDNFCRACGVDLLRQMGERNYLRHTLAYKRPFAHLSPQQYRTFLKQCGVWKEMKKNGQ